RASAAAERLPLGLLAAAELRGAAGDARELLAARGVEDALLRLEDALRLDPEHAAADECRAPTLERRQPQLGNDVVAHAQLPLPPPSGLNQRELRRGRIIHSSRLCRERDRPTGGVVPAGIVHDCPNRRLGVFEVRPLVGALLSGAPERLR